MRYARRTTAVLARAGIRRATVIEWQCHEMSEVSRGAGRGRKLPPPARYARRGAACRWHASCTDRSEAKTRRACTSGHPTADCRTWIRRADPCTPVLPLRRYKTGLAKENKNKINICKKRLAFIIKVCYITCRTVVTYHAAK